MLNLALYQPDIPQNTAAIIRLCSCFDTTLEIIEPCGFHIDDKRLKRVAMDYFKNVKIIRYQNFNEFLKKKNKSRIILMTTKAKKSYCDFKFKLKDTILLGRESSGVPKFIHNMVYERLKIPLNKKTRSLNISIAAAIVLSEALRQNSLF